MGSGPHRDRSTRGCSAAPALGSAPAAAARRGPTAPRLPAASQSPPHGPPVRPAPLLVGGRGGARYGAALPGGGRPGVTFTSGGARPVLPLGRGGWDLWCCPTPSGLCIRDVRRW